MLDDGVNVVAEDGAEVARIHGYPLVGRGDAHVSLTSRTEPYIGFEDGSPVLDSLKSITEKAENIIWELEATL